VRFKSASTFPEEIIKVKNRKLLEDGLECLDVGVCIVDANNKVIFIDKFATGILNFPADKSEIMGNRLKHANQILFPGKIAAEVSTSTFPVEINFKANGSMSYFVEMSKYESIGITQTPLSSGGHISQYSMFDFDPEHLLPKKGKQIKPWGFESESIFLEASSLEIYRKIFPRPEHDTYSYAEEDQAYFGDEARLSAFEFGELENYGDQFTPLLMKGFLPQTEVEEAFCACVAGRQAPKSLPEAIFVKLLYQALAMGGLHYDGSEGEFRHNEVKCANDIGSISSFALKDVLHSATELAEFYSLVVTSDSDDLEDEEEDSEERQEQRELEDDIYDELNEYMEWAGNSGDEGWFYGDD
jgi:hypothetical protein